MEWHIKGNVFDMSLFSISFTEMNCAQVRILIEYFRKLSSR